MTCFQNAFIGHEHPQTSFAVQILTKDVTDFEPGLQDGKIDYEKDTFEMEGWSEFGEGNLVMTALKGVRRQSVNKKVCAFCHGDRYKNIHLLFSNFLTSVKNKRENSLGHFHFLLKHLTTLKRFQSLGRRFFGPTIHVLGIFFCTVYKSFIFLFSYSPEVFVSPVGEWYNVLSALKRSKKMICAGCKEKGATVGCFDPKCSKRLEFYFINTKVKYVNITIVTTFLVPGSLFPISKRVSSTGAQNMKAR